LEVDIDLSLPDYPALKTVCSCLIVALVGLCCATSIRAEPDVARVTEAEARINIDGQLDEPV
jgi:hypothetical protein